MTLIEQLAQYELKTIQFNGVQQSYREAGKGKTLVLLHGISSGSGSWVKQLQNLSPYFHVIAWDAPGYGKSDELTTKQPTAQDYANRLKEMLDALALKDIVLVGHSLGALIFQQFLKLSFLDEHDQINLILLNLELGLERDNVLLDFFLVLYPEIVLRNMSSYIAPFYLIKLAMSYNKNMYISYFNHFIKAKQCLYTKQYITYKT